MSLMDEAVAAARSKGAGTPTTDPNDPLIYTGASSSPTRKGGGQDTESGLERQGTQLIFKTYSQMENEPLLWSKKKLQRTIALAKRYGYANAFKTGDTLANFMPVWDAMLKAGAAYVQAGKNVTPFDALQLMNDGVKGDPSQAPFTGDRTTESTTIDTIDKATADQLLDQSLSQYLGREATAEEKADFLSRAQALAAENPAKSRTTTHYEDGEATGTTTETLSNGLTSAMMNEAAKDQAQSSSEYGAFQAAAFLLPELFKAADSPV